jgi:putative intracellular protease/amidase
VTSYSDRDAERSDLRQAYELGRRDARKQRRRHPILMTFVVIAAAVGLVVMALAAVNGSFSGAGTVVDQNLATAADQAEPVVRGAAADAGQAVRDVTSTDRTETPARN